MEHPDELQYYNAIAIASRSGYATMKRYHTACGGSWRLAYDAFIADIATLEEKDVTFPDPAAAYEHLAALGIRLVLANQEEFPDALRHIPYPPFGIYLRGGIPPLQNKKPPTVAVVGTRHASMDGKATARAFARALAGAGCTITSGLAFGIDAAAHEGALDANGRTIAVLAGGLDAVYPQSHRGLAERILANGGALISEYPPGETPVAYRFIERNRIMSGISRGVLIVEAPESSGALATARYAVEQNREVFVVPGAIGAKNFKGSHALIRQGAELVTSPDDIFDAYDIDKKKYVCTADKGASPEEILILQALGALSSPADVDKIIAMTRLEPRIANRTLSILLIRGIVKETDAGYTI